MFKEDRDTVLMKELTPDIIKNVIAFSNRRFGNIYIGVSDSGEVIGIDNLDESIIKIKNYLDDYIMPDITNSTYIKPIIIGGKNIIKISIAEGTRKPYYFKKRGLNSNGVYIRDGNESIQASEDIINNMMKLSDGNSFELNRSLNQDLHFNYFEREMMSKKTTVLEIQKNINRTINVDKLYTNLGLLVSDECKHSIELFVFEGDDKLSVLKDSRTFTGSIIAQLNNAYSFIHEFNDLHAKFDNSKVITNRNYPSDSIKECLLNAILHRDYSFSGSTIINIYSDRMEFISLGGLVSGLSIEAIKAGASQPRNEKLVKLFNSIKITKTCGAGIGKILSEYKNHNVKPEFKDVNGAFVAVLPNINYVPENKNYSENENHAKIIEYLKSNDGITRKEVENLCGVKTTQANNIIKEMIATDRIERIGSGKNVKYILK